MAAPLFNVDGWLNVNESNGRTARRYFGLRGKLLAWWLDKEKTNGDPAGKIDLAHVKSLSTEGSSAFVMELVDKRHFLFQGETEQATKRFFNVLRATWDTVNRRSGFGPSSVAKPSPTASSAPSSVPRRDSTSSVEGGSRRDSGLSLPLAGIRGPLGPIAEGGSDASSLSFVLSGPCSPIPTMGPSMSEPQAVVLSPSPLEMDGGTAVPTNSGVRTSSNSSISMVTIEKKGSWTKRLLSTFSFGSHSSSSSSSSSSSGAGTGGAEQLRRLSSGVSSSLPTPVSTLREGEKTGFVSPTITVEVRGGEQPFPYPASYPLRSPAASSVVTAGSAQTSRYPSSGSVGSTSNPGRKSSAVIAPLSICASSSSTLLSSGGGSGAATGNPHQLGSRSSTISDASGPNSNNGISVRKDNSSFSVQALGGASGTGTETGRIALMPTSSAPGIVPFFSQQPANATTGAAASFSIPPQRKLAQHNSLSSGHTTSSSGLGSNSRNGSGLYTQQDPWVQASNAPTTGAGGHPPNGENGGSGMFFPPETVGGSELYGSSPASNRTSPAASSGAFIFTERGSSGTTIGPAGKSDDSSGGGMISASRSKTANLGSIVLSASHEGAPVPPADLMVGSRSVSGTSTIPDTAASSSASLRVNLPRAWGDIKEEPAVVAEERRRSALARLSESKEESNESKDEVSFDQTRPSKPSSIIYNATGIATPAAGGRSSVDDHTSSSSGDSSSSSSNSVAAVTKVESDDSRGTTPGAPRSSITVTVSAAATSATPTQQQHFNLLHQEGAAASAVPSGSRIIVHHRESTEGDATVAALAALAALAESKEQVDDSPTLITPATPTTINNNKPDSDGGKGLKALLVASVSATPLAPAVVLTKTASVPRKALPGAIPTGSSSGSGSDDGMHVGDEGAALPALSKR